MAEPSLLSVLGGLESYLAYEKLQGVTRVEVNQVVRIRYLKRWICQRLGLQKRRLWRPVVT